MFVPSGIKVEMGDIVEVRVGHPEKKGVPGALNTVLRIREKAGDANRMCRWEPPDERLWTRVLYADWMPQEGWLREKGSPLVLYPPWYKPAPVIAP